MTGEAWRGGVWARVAEHVARIERVAQIARDVGLPQAALRFGESAHAIELATLFQLSTRSGECSDIQPSLVIAVLRQKVDELLVYGPFLQFLVQIGMADEDGPAFALSVYRDFCAALESATGDGPMWTERVQAARDGLASFHVQCGDLAEGHALFARRHEEEGDGLLVALSASRAFLSVGARSQALTWLELGAQRADELGRPQVAAKLRAKRARLSGPR